LGLASHDLIGRRYVIEPELTLRYRPSRFLDGQFDRIVAFEERTTRTIEHNRHFSGVRSKPALVASTMRNVLINLGNLLSLRSSVRIVPWAGYNFTPAPKKFSFLRTGALCTSMMGLEYFGHWISEDCPLHYLATDFGVPVGIPLKPWPHAAWYTKHLEVEACWADHVLVGELVVFDDLGFGDSKTKRLLSMRRKIADHFPANTPSSIVYLSRGKTGNPRRMMAEHEFIERLSLLGIKILHVEHDPIDTIVQTIRTARILITLEGSHGAHALCALPQGSGLLELVPPERFCTRHKEWADAVGLDYGFLVGTKREQGFDFPIDDLLRTLDLML
jgi:capsular polysaccharide biosynthesis protein